MQAIAFQWKATCLVAQCPRCRLGVFSLWPGHEQIGITHNGGLAEFVTRARALIRELKKEEDPRSHAYILVWAQTEIGDLTAANETFKEFIPTHTFSLMAIATGKAKAGDVAGALKMAEDMEDGWWKGNLLRYLAYSQTERGDEKAALVWIKRLDSPLLRANALFGVAEALGKIER